MYNHIVNSAIKNIWCDPKQDNQMILKLARISKYLGDKKTTRVIWQTLLLPDDTSFWHVFQIGQVHPLLLNLYPKNNEWIALSDVSAIQDIHFDIYNINGIQIPRFEVYYTNNLEKNLIVAIRHNSKIPINYNKDEIFLRLYSNAFYTSDRAINLNTNIKVLGKNNVALNDINDLIDFENTHKNLQGKTDVYINGFLHETILTNATLGDTIEVVYDASFYKEVLFTVKDLLSFDSILDLKKKYLLHYSGADNGNIDYQDDVDIQVFMLRPNNKLFGLYYHKNNEDSLRNLTHRDYSICVPYVGIYADILSRLKNNNTSLSLDKIIVKLSIRQAGFVRPLIFENSRIHELYKMNDNDIVRSMLGFDALVDVWRAENLEKSAYVEIMRKNVCEITIPMAQDAFGYNASSRIIGDTPSRVYLESGLKCVNIPYILQKSCTAYEYDINGQFLGWRVAPPGERYFVQNNNTEYVELISGIGGNILDEHYDIDNMGINEKISFRVYSCKKIQGIPDNKFKDITNSNLYKIENSRFIWLDNSFNTYHMVRFDTRFLAIDKQLQMNDGILKLTLTHLQKRNTQISNWIMQIPMGEIEVILNKKSLIRGLDYIYNFPEIIITNKKYLIDPENQLQDVHIRFTGFCKSNFELNEVLDVGFIEHGLLSNNNIFNIRDDKVLRITMDGNLYLKEDLQYSEMTPGISVLNPINGMPYSIKDIVVPMRGETILDTYAYREKSLKIDEDVSDILTLKIPQPQRNAPSAIIQRYPIFSPFICKLVYDLALDRLILEDKIYNKQQIIDLMKKEGYEDLAKIDVTQAQFEPDQNYVVINPHSLNSTIGLSLNKYRFLLAVTNLYTRGLVNLSPFVQLI